MEKQVRHRLGEDTPELMRYHKTYQGEFARKWQAASQADLWTQIADSQVVLMGDFHALHQSQKAQLRVLRNIPKDRKTVLVVEFFDAADQSKLDKFMQGKMSEKDFLKSVKWETRWGFPWEHYRPILRYAQKHKIPVYGLNKAFAKRNATTLKSRDVFAGKKIAELTKTHPDSLVFVIYGDLHLAGAHIPAEIQKNLGKPFAKKVLSIFQNAEKIYFQLLNQGAENITDLIRINRNTFCLMSVPPWVKWQNYLMYLEQTYDEGLRFQMDDEDDDWDEDENSDFEPIDFTDHVGRYVKIMAEELGLEVSLSALSVYTAHDDSFWSQVRENYDLKKQTFIQRLIEDEYSFYLPEISAAYLARGTVNHAATLAMQYVHAQVSGAKTLFAEMPQDFLRWIWMEAVAYFGSKMINPKRKTDTIADIKASLVHKDSSDIGKEALQLALSQKMHELMMITGVPKHKLQAKPRRKASYMVAATLLGGMMGERLFYGYQKKLLKTSMMASFIEKPLDNKNFEVAYYGILEVVESLPTPFHSKKEKL
ncbi:ChaN family lipoprotein [Bdellovibrio sp. SKB1291214]|uniref:ChaN family lipoprotein n=1 Tax=Bdellovibrio sp. SKB1291214 TaxID=1732569 RepID=UPI000B514D90|nr:ChaN family lipoprotein [Bdellovibrio sp. SKB1291214]UYL08224.1 ChaN family lipoprotein [Bdellovibrio sp. SKB1291214]